MKLSELIFETQILLEEETFVVRKTPDGRRWGVYNTTSGTSVFISGHKSKGQAERAVEKLKNPTPPKPKDDTRISKKDRNKSKVKKSSPTGNLDDIKTNKLTAGMAKVNSNKWLLTLPDGKTVLQITNENDANLLGRHFDDLKAAGKTPQQITEAFTGKKLQTLIKTLGVSKLPDISTSPIKRSINAIKLAEFELLMKAKASTPGRIATWVTSSWGFNSVLKPIVKKVAPLADPIAVVLGVFRAIDEVQEEMEQADAAGDDKKYQRLELEADILRGQLVVMLVSIFTYYLSIARWARAILTIFSSVATVIVAKLGIAATAATGGAAAGAAAIGTGATFLIANGVSFIVFYLLADPTFQRKIAQIIAGTILGDVVQDMGSYVNDALLSVEELVAGKYGTRFLADNLTTEEKTVGGVEGEYYSNSEWAKLVFGTLLFPPGQKTKLVPFIPESKRDNLLSGVLGIEAVDAPPKLSPRLDTKGETPEPSINSGAPGFRPGQ